MDRWRSLRDTIHQDVCTRGYDADLGAFVQSYGSRQLDASRAQIQAIYDNSPDWLSLFRATPDGRFVYEDLNTATERAYGLPRDRVVGRSVEEVLGIEQARLPISLFRECVRTGENQRYTAHRTMAGATRTIDVMFARVPEKRDGDWVVVTAPEAKRPPGPARRGGLTASENASQGLTLSAGHKQQITGAKTLKATLDSLLPAQDPRRTQLELAGVDIHQKVPVLVLGISGEKHATLVVGGAGIDGLTRPRAGITVIGKEVEVLPFANDHTRTARRW